MELIKEKRVTSKESGPWWSWICDGVPLRFFVFKCLLSVWCRLAPLALFPHLIGHAIWRSGLWCLVYDGCCASISLTLYYFTHDIRIINIISITLSVCCAYKNSLRKEKETETKIKIRMKIKKNCTAGAHGPMNWQYFMAFVGNCDLSFNLRIVYFFFGVYFSFKQLENSK